MDMKRIRVIYLKDLRDAIRDSRVLVALLVPLGIGVLYNVLFQGASAATVPQVTIAYVSAGTTALPAEIKTTIGTAAKVTVIQVSSAQTVRSDVTNQTADVGVIIPQGFDAAVRSGSTPSLTIVQPSSPNTGAAIVGATLDSVLRQMAGQHPPAIVSVDTVTSSQLGMTGIITQVGFSEYFVLAAVMMVISMISLLAIPIVLGEERDKKTLEALVLISSYREVVIAKALLGLTYIAAAIAILLALTKVRPVERLPFIGGVALLSIGLIGFGLLVGGLFTPQQINSFGSLLLLPILLPPFLVGLPLPGIVQGIFDAIPSSQAMRLVLNSTSKTPFYTDQWLSYLVLLAWIVVAYALLLWRLSREEG